ncbi:hypothetical protein TWF225_010702 [Orbilia oligospora]|nr:hypothetical protein TWF225_010702 [Orbilia oligospora]KAF3240622.1 hypothetical protein TWF128_011237 [Orbilia oligospora]KAF3243678.1 hypothetical protein TWF217_011187 [Orbilia oligospora]KAF3281859.1 hypothetical protein TWF132_011081 [Orbilia oligospora]
MAHTAQEVDPVDVLYIYLPDRLWSDKPSKLFNHPRNKSRTKLVHPALDYVRVRRQRAIVLSLKNPPRNIRRGWVFGTDPNTADIILDDASGISSEHFTIGFNLASGVLILTDHSFFGTFYSPAFDATSPQRLHHRTTILAKENSISFGEVLLWAVSPQTESSDKKYQQELVTKLGTIFTGTVSPIIPQALDLADELRPNFAVGKVIHQLRSSQPYRLSIVTQIATGDKYIGKIFQHRHNYNQEICFLRDLKHNHIINARWVIKKPMNTYALMPCAKGSLYDFDFISWNFDRKIALATQMSEGLRYLHSLGISHGDIKPENIFVFSLDPFFLKIGDLGSAAKSEVRSLKVGTITYAAPEIHLKAFPDPNQFTKPYFTKPTDIWSFGLILLECYNTAHRSRKYSERWKYHGAAAATAASVSKNADVLSRLISQTIKIAPAERLTAIECCEICQGSPSPPADANAKISVSSKALTVDIQTETSNLRRIDMIQKIGLRQSFLRPETEYFSAYTKLPAQFPVWMESTQLITIRTEIIPLRLVQLASTTSVHQTQYFSLGVTGVFDVRGRGQEDAAAKESKNTGLQVAVHGATVVNAFIGWSLRSKHRPKNAYVASGNIAASRVAKARPRKMIKRL